MDTNNGEQANDEGGKGLIRGTISKGKTYLAVMLSAAAALADAGMTATASAVATAIGANQYDVAQGELIGGFGQLYFNGADPSKFTDTDGKPVYIGFHPFRAGRFGIWRSELLAQVTANREAERQADTKRNEKAAARADAAKAKADKLAKRAKDMLDKASKLTASASKLAEESGLDLDGFKAEAQAEADTGAALASVTNEGTAATV